MPRTTNTTAPLISLEVSTAQDSLTLVWTNVSSDECPVEGYVLYLDGQMVGEMVRPDKESKRCRVTIEKLQVDYLHKVVVGAIRACKNNNNYQQQQEAVNTNYLRSSTAISFNENKHRC